MQPKSSSPANKWNLIGSITLTVVNAVLSVWLGYGNNADACTKFAAFPVSLSVLLSITALGLMALFLGNSAHRKRVVVLSIIWIVILLLGGIVLAFIADGTPILCGLDF